MNYYTVQFAQADGFNRPMYYPTLDRALNFYHHIISRYMQPAQVWRVQAVIGPEQKTTKKTLLLDSRAERHADGGFYAFVDGEEIVPLCRESDDGIIRINI